MIGDFLAGLTSGMRFIISAAAIFAGLYLFFHIMDD